MFSFLRRKPNTFFYPGEEIRSLRTPGATASHSKASQKAVQAGAAHKSLETGRARLIVTGGLFVLAYAAVAIRLIDVMVLKAEDRPIAERIAATTEVKPRRADIVDRNGVVLATNLPTVNLYVDSTKVIDPAEGADKLVSALPHLNRHDVLTKLSSGKRFVYLDRNLTPKEQAAVNAEGVPGVFFENSERRAYLQGPLLSHVLGATDPENNGIGGLELSFDQRLKQNPDPLRLSIDARVQFAVRSTLMKAVETFQAIGAMGLVLDVRTGEIISMVSLPDFDPESFGNSDPNTRFNRATLGVYEMGSTFKVFNTAMALESGQIRATDVYDTTSPLKIARFTINDDHPARYNLNVGEILIKSSNIGSARMAVQMGPTAQRKFLGEIGLLESAKIEVPENGFPLVPPVQNWKEIATMTISYGHGIAVTPVHLAKGLSAMVNGGVLRQPTLLLGNVQDGKRVIREETSATVRKLMRMVVTDGTARKADVPGYEVGGKTGTADKAAAGGYDTKRLLTTFAGAFPISDPKYLVIVSLDEPKPLKSTYGFATSGWNAAPTAGALIAEIGPILGVQPTSVDDLPKGGAGAQSVSLTSRVAAAVASVVPASYNKPRPPAPPRPTGETNAPR
ncbi:peptidoglycan D,D-transpeptidase FtsI family protein [Novispirillum itersonii]|uniref:Cell division protein FtsI (Penicillin-binding protein 3) n=1 Tax=Novispirillum itersonii TaxID=189 RepID=A0A7X0DL06_NOVIT|nr:penicillin-binding protein 2 [Novispirillum itersonii]MBB6209523.1 cell division protein FtsI (penicillin-binding protein 3) [Novispirillum itersonii]